MAFDTTTGVYTPVTGATTAAPGVIIASAVWNNINGDEGTALTLLGQQLYGSTVVNFAASPYTPLAADTLLEVTSAGGAITIDLPTAASRNGYPLRIKDAGFQAVTNNITVVPNGLETIDNINANLVIANNGGGYWFVPIAGGWLILAGTASEKDVMTAAQYQNDTTGKILSTDRVWAAAQTVTLTDAATVTMDFSTFINAKLTGTGGVGATRTLGAATNVKVGQSGIIEWYPVTGALNLIIPTGSTYVASGGIASLVPSNTNGLRDAIVYSVLNDGKVLLSLLTNLTT